MEGQQCHPKTILQKYIYTAWDHHERRKQRTLNLFVQEKLSYVVIQGSMFDFHADSSECKSILHTRRVDSS